MRISEKDLKERDGAVAHLAVWEFLSWLYHETDYMLVDPEKIRYEALADVGVIVPDVYADVRALVEEWKAQRASA